MILYVIQINFKVINLLEIIILCIEPVIIKCYRRLLQFTIDFIVANVLSLINFDDRYCHRQFRGYQKSMR